MLIFLRLFCILAIIVQANGSAMVRMLVRSLNGPHALCPMLHPSPSCHED